ncbi:MAG: protein-L-isoaspartate(D-aspartate) O-methyltransferase [Planctomycetota bacterium]|nr:protein-L-isoaspartate(D-aspartate) O-methyltransferase [Planctomycetota bacterium]
MTDVHPERDYQGRGLSTRVIGQLLAMLPVLVLVSPVPAQQGQFQQHRLQMVKEAIMDAGVKNPRVIESMQTTKRHEFVASRFRKQAYFDMALPIGDRQTISSPFIVAYMTEALDPQATDRVLEIGTGSGYQAAILSPLVKTVYTIEIVESLGLQATRTLERLGYQNVHTRIGDGFQGWKEHAPFDKIIVTCSPENIPQPLVDQLREGGRMVIPTGERYQQTLYLLTKKNGQLVSEALRPTLFVPMTGRAEQARLVKPNPLRPQAVNGTMEKPGETKSFVAGWYYQRQVKRVSDPDARQGRHFAHFQNETPGRASHMLQGLAIDGRRISQIELEAWIRAENISQGRNSEEVSMLAISFYNTERRELSSAWIGPFRGTTDWLRLGKTVRVPLEAREAILRIGLFGSTGELDVDDIRITPRRR